LAKGAINEFGQITALDWLQEVVKLLYASENEIKASAFFSPGDDCLHRIRRLISKSRKALDICVFTITDNRIVQRLEESQARGVQIRIISDDDESMDLGSDLARLSKAEINCRLDQTTAPHAPQICHRRPGSSPHRQLQLDPLGRHQKRRKHRSYQ
jgi:cardiolipin hydrolase